MYLVLGYCIKKGSASSQTSAEILQLYKVGLFERSQRETCHSHHKNMLPANRLVPLCWCCCTEVEISGSPLGVLVRRQKKNTKADALVEAWRQHHNLHVGAKWKTGKSESASPWAQCSAGEAAASLTGCTAAVYPHQLTPLYSVYFISVHLLITLTAEMQVPSCCCSLETFHWLRRVQAGPSSCTLQGRSLSAFLVYKMSFIVVMVFYQLYK